ncbi:hypothetical protein E1264_38100 [Actinomadura sp. KC216]|nr:hypothetical protein E1264_38100 [Actinomadura sp. KC216]
MTAGSSFTSSGFPTTRRWTRAGSRAARTALHRRSPSRRTTTRRAPPRPRKDRRASPKLPRVTPSLPKPRPREG